MKCKYCNKEIQTHYYNVQDLIDNQQCFDCNFWMNILKEYVSHRHFVYNGECYAIGEEDPSIPSSCRGFSGAHVRITKFTGEVIESSNLWYQGRIPERFRNKFPDDAILEWNPSKDEKVIVLPF